LAVGGVFQDLHLAAAQWKWEHMRTGTRRRRRRRTRAGRIARVGKQTTTKTKSVACRTAASLDSTGAGRGWLGLPDSDSDNNGEMDSGRPWLAAQAHGRPGTRQRRAQQMHRWGVLVPRTLGFISFSFSFSSSSIPVPGGLGALGLGPGAWGLGLCVSGRPPVSMSTCHQLLPTPPTLPLPSWLSPLSSPLPSVGTSHIPVQCWRRNQPLLFPLALLCTS
jgi:hypothetical protein